MHSRGMYKIIGADGKEYGPITADQLRQWVAEGRVNTQTKILPEGTTEWRPLSAFPEFVTAIPSAPPTLPTQPGQPAYGGVPAGGGAATDQVNGPAIGLLVLGIIEILVNVLSIIVNLAGATIFASRQDDAMVRMFSGTIGIASGVLGILLAALIIFGAIKMKRLESYALAMTASIVAMLPCSFCCVIGLPIGIWALVVLSKPEVKSSFR